MDSDDRKKPAVPLHLDAVRLTRQRKIILDVLSNVEGHLTFDELYAAVRLVDSNVGNATLHRTLRLLVQGGQVEELRFEGHVTRFERSAPAHHDHLICRVCGNIVEFEDERLEALQEEVAARHGFAIRSHRHELYGICPPCQISRHLAEDGQ